MDNDKYRKGLPQKFILYYSFAEKTNVNCRLGYHGFNNLVLPVRK
jgi:hypothetical protein